MSSLTVLDGCWSSSHQTQVSGCTFEKGEGRNRMAPPPFLRCCLGLTDDTPTYSWPQLGHMPTTSTKRTQDLKSLSLLDGAFFILLSERAIFGGHQPFLPVSCEGCCCRAALVRRPPDKLSVSQGKEHCPQGRFLQGLRGCLLLPALPLARPSWVPGHPA